MERELSEALARWRAAHAFDAVRAIVINGRQHTR
jgi:hypothetical protein